MSSSTGEPFGYGASRRRSRHIRLRRATAVSHTKYDLLLICLSAVLLTFVWRIHLVFPILAKLQLPSIASLGAYALFLLDRDPRRKLNFLRHPVTAILIAIFVLMVVTLPFGLVPSRSFSFLVRDHVKTLIFVLLLAVSIRSFSDVETTAGIQVFGAAVASAFFLLKYPATGSTGLGLYDNNDFSLVVVGVLPLAVYFVLRPRNRAILTRLASLVALALLLAAAVVTDSRAGFLGLVAIGAYLVLRFKAIPVRVRLVVVAAGIAGLAVVAQQAYWERVSTLTDLKSDYNWAGGSPTGRMEVWKRGVGYMFEDPVTGVGVGNFKSAEGRSEEGRRRLIYGRGWKFSSPHNSFIQIGAELGLFGLLLFIALLACAFRTVHCLGKSARSLTVRRRGSAALLAQALGGSILGYIVVGFFLSHAYSAFAYSIFAMIAGLDRVSQPETGRGATAARMSQQRRRGWRRASLPEVPVGTTSPALQSGSVPRAGNH